MQESFELLAQFIRIETMLILPAIGLLLFFKIATGEINLFGLITDKRTGEISPARIQSLILTFSAAGFLLLGIPRLTGTISDLAPMVFGGSQAIYLYSKYESYRR